MTENIFKDGGEFCMRGDPQQRPVEWYWFKTIDIEGLKQSICYLDPMTHLLRTTYSNGRQTPDKLNNADLTPIPKPPELVPWDCPDDVPEPCWIRMKTRTNSNIQEVYRLFALFNNGAYLGNSDGFSFLEMFNQCEWHTDRKAKDGWKPCGKVKT